ncbi:DNA/RNA non-specific endonuclease [Halodesulfovibrio spirochaetisodalis]|uniref:DNA/RNA non-specific endonuclease n=1 Tax=Halodesulfovibrio spirochaetisodalis TaxID=1560234 RepID=UPI00082ECF32|nr:DNA/RNA non-specific endonuclease [Halodesulfovibrio spirochaetisodalis]
MRKSLLLALILIVISIPSLTCAEIYKNLIPEENISESIIHHDFYSIGYDEDTEQPAWVMYEFTVKEATAPKVQRKDRFRPDPAIPTRSATLRDYKKSGFDRGHLAPAADMAFSKQAMRDSFFMSNMSPQRPSFNRGIWKKLEALVRSWAKKDTIIVVTAGVLEGEQHIGRNKVLVPEWYYKIIYVPSKRKAIGFLLPNTGSKAALTSFVVPVDVIEGKTGIDFFASLDDGYEAVLEGNVCIEDWRW